MDNIKVVGEVDTLKSIPDNPNWHLVPIEMLGKPRRSARSASRSRTRLAMAT
jgi:hypothetical protein